MMATKPYRPSNGSEGEWFESRFCGRCEAERKWREDKGDGCSIHILTYALNADEPKYPKEWIEDDGGPRCTAFRPEGSHDPEKVAADRAKYEAAMAEMRAARGLQITEIDNG